MNFLFLKQYLLAEVNGDIFVDIIGHSFYTKQKDRTTTS